MNDVGVFLFTASLVLQMMLAISTVTVWVATDGDLESRANLTWGNLGDSKDILVMPFVLRWKSIGAGLLGVMLLGIALRSLA